MAAGKLAETKFYLLQPYVYFTLADPACLSALQMWLWLCGCGSGLTNVAVAVLNPVLNPTAVKPL